MYCCERSKAYKMRLDTIKQQGARTDLTAPKQSAMYHSDDEVGNAEGVSGDTIRNIFYLNNLALELMQMVDEKTISMTPAFIQDRCMANGRNNRFHKAC